MPRGNSNRGKRTATDSTYERGQSSKGKQGKSQHTKQGQSNTNSGRNSRGGSRNS